MSLVDAEEPGRPPSRRKSTKRWCRGKVGREHQPEMILDQRRLGGYWGLRCRPFGYDLPGVPNWHCMHIVVCTECGKILDHRPECPDMPEGYRNRWRR
jgi:hypothetical protein